MYGKIIWRRFWLVVLVVGVVALYVSYQYYHLRKTPGALKAYRSDITIQIGLQASNTGEDPSYADQVVVSESLADALVTGPILTSKEFDTQVCQQIIKDLGPNSEFGTCQDTGSIGGAITSVRAHSLVTLSVTWPTDQGAKAISKAIGEVSVANIGAYLDYVVAKDSLRTASTSTVQPIVSARVISDATDAVAVPGTSANKQTLLILLLLIALIIGIALAFFVDYLDDRIYSKAEVQELLQLPLYGEIPRAPRSGLQASRQIQSPIV